MARRKRVGLRHESKSTSERRVPVIPADLASIPADWVVQPSSQRAIPEGEFVAAGAQLNSDLSTCDIILGVKEVPLPELMRRKVYLFFSHVIKGQPYNMPLLQHVLDQESTLIDYECIVDSKNGRLVGFGRQAGQAGTINAFFSMNQRLRSIGGPNPFGICKQAKDYESIQAAKSDLQTVGLGIQSEGLPESLSPFLVVVTGAGNVAKGSFDVLDALPCLKKWSAGEALANIEAKNYDRKSIYLVVLDAGDLYTLQDSSSTLDFSFDAFGANPENYVSTVPKYFPHMTMLINCVFWKPEFPRFLTKSFLRDMWGSPAVTKRNVIIADITCDIEGSVESTIRSTDPSSPCYVYHPEIGTATDGFEGEGIVVMAVDILPTEQPVESSTAFSRALCPLLPALIAADFSADFESLELPDPLKNGVVAHKGKLAPRFEYLGECLTRAKSLYL
eukprot:NODE_1799_length_1403_cov_3.134417_g1627_i0.p1 GENE.NODE_1799_length_1403_cov_3.134417_g1627_i0~~NODE_1799_length_1403_cov_3.134417_g1627_i0.p1  ORF type:complete len:466 (+),score=80.58 NODE_1799_length_1403_cov_3.134417_g1627_i0:60-1400(+)